MSSLLLFSTLLVVVSSMANAAVVSGQTYAPVLFTLLGLASYLSALALFVPVAERLDGAACNYRVLWIGATLVYATFLSPTYVWDDPSLAWAGGLCVALQALAILSNVLCAVRQAYSD